MRWAIGFLLISIGFYVGYHFGAGEKVELPKSPVLTALESEMNQLTAAELQEYQQLKDQKEKYEKANEILSKVMQIFLADLGLRMQNPKLHVLNESQRDSSIQIASSTKMIPARGTPPVSTSATDLEASGSGASTESLAETSRKSARPSGGGASQTTITVEQERAAIGALFLAILWRLPEPSEETRFKETVRRGGWVNFINVARILVTSGEFQSLIEPTYSVEQIINRMHAVFLGRCARKGEMTTYLNQLRNRGSTRVVTEILDKVQSRETLYNGGYSPTTCASN